MATETFIFELRTRGAKRSAADIRRIGKSANQVRRTLAFLRSALVVVASVRVFAKLVGGLADFAQAMATVKAVTGATTQQFARMRDVAKELGATTRFTATEAAEGILALGRAGFDTSEIIATIPQTLALAQAGALDLGKASEITAGALRAFGLATSQAERVVDVFTFTANSSLNTVLDLGEAMKLVAPIASGVGVTIEELAASLATLGNVNIRASLAGTGLRRVITDLESPTGDLAKILDKLNISHEKVRVSTVGFAAALKVLSDAGVGATLAARAFGKRGAAIFAVLARNSDSTDKFSAALENIQGITKKTADIMDDNLNGALLKTKSALEAVLLALGDLGVETFLQQFFEGLADVLRAVAKNIGNVVSAIGVLIKAFIALKAIRLILFLVNVRKSFALLWLVISRNPIGLVVGAFAAITSVMVGFQDQIKLTEEGSQTMGDALTAFSEIMDEEVTRAVNALGFEFEDFAGIVKSVVEVSVDAFIFLLRGITGVVAAIRVRFIELRRDQLQFAIERRKQFNEFESLLGGAPKAVQSFFEFFGFDPEAGARELIDLEVKLNDVNKALTDLKKTPFEAFLDGFDSLPKRIAQVEALRIAMETISLPADRGDLDVPFVDQQINPGLSADFLNRETKSREAMTNALRKLEAAQFPFIKQLLEEAEVIEIITDARARGITFLTDENELKKRIIRSNLGLGMSTEQLAEEIKKLNLLRQEGIISLKEEEVLIRKVTIAQLDQQRTAGAGIERAFLKLQDDASNAAKFTEKVFNDAFESVSDGITNMILGIEQDFGSFIRDLGAQLVKLGVQQALLSAGSLFPGAPSSPTSNIAGIGGFITGGLKSLFGFSHGGTFRVGGNTAIESLPGIDNRLVAFRARDGEEVTVTPKNSGVGGVGPTNIVFNVVTRDADSFLRSQSQLQNRALAGIAQARRKR